MSVVTPVYLFRGLTGHGDFMVVSAARLDLVVSVFGGGPLHGEGGLVSAFGGAAFFKNEETSECYLGVWGARKVSRFRQMLQGSGAALTIVRERPPARLIRLSSNKGGRPRLNRAR